MFEALFGVPFGALAGARLELALPLPLLGVLAAFAVVAALALGGYLPAARGRRGLAWLRAALALLAVVAIARPELVVPVRDAGGAPVAVLLDDSRSMSVGAPGSAGEQALALLAPGEGTLGRELERRFRVRHHRFDAALRDGDGAAPRFRGAVSDPLGALLEAAGSGKLSGLVLASDGGQVGGRDVGDALTRLRAAGVPVHVVGVGAPTIAPDLAVESVSVTPVALEGDRVDLTVWLRASGLDGATVPVTVRDDGVLVAQRRVRIDGARASTRLEVRLDEPGLRPLEVQARLPGGDAVPGNDTLRRLVQVRGQPVRVLHVEGEPRFEVKFVRRAVAGDPAIALASLVRTGDNRFLRLGALDPDELAQGFPESAEELFRYHVLVLGSVQAAALGAPALALLHEFVARRGGSVLFLGGHQALAEGGFGDTPVAGMLPVRLRAPAPQFRVAAAAVLTREGLAHPVTRGLSALSGDGPGLPALAVVNPVREPKPGASVLLEGVDGGEPALVLLAWHRFGAGRVAVLPARDVWRWRMHADVPLEDRSHEMLWRGLLRWLAREVPAQVAVSTGPDPAAPGQALTVRARIRDAAWRALPDAAPRVLLTTPLGDIHERAMTLVPGAEPQFHARFAAAEAGVHELRVEVARDGEPPLTGSGGLLVEAAGEEFRSPGLDETLLARIARETGGSYRRAADAAGLAERVAASAPAEQAWRRLSLWNAPALLLAMLALAATEWWLRRRRRELP